MSVEKFKLLCWKNFTLQKRHPIAALFEIVFPILIVILFSAVRDNFENKPHDELKFNSFKPLDYKNCRSGYEPLLKLGVSPASNTALADLVNSSVGKNSKMKIEFFDNSSSLDFFLSHENNTVGIEFNDKLAVSIVIHAA
jgi:ATP-binding cassette, subfamily A (ABC1), member 3